MVNFNWADSDDVVMRSVDAIAVYENTEGDIVILQQNMADGEDSLIVIPGDYVCRVISALTRANNERENGS